VKCGLRADQSEHDPPARLWLTEVYVNPTARVLPSPRSLHSTPGPGGGCFDPAQTNLIAHRMRQVCLPDGLAMFRPVRQHAIASATCGSVRGVLSEWGCPVFARPHSVAAFPDASLTHPGLSLSLVDALDEPRSAPIRDTELRPARELPRICLKSGRRMTRFQGARTPR